MILINIFGIALCLLHSAMFSGLNLGFFGISRLKLEVQAEGNDKDALRILKLRQDTHFLLSTLLWGNVSSNVLLTLLTDSVMSGVAAFFFSTIGITFFGEIIPQAYLARHFLKFSPILVPVVHFYQFLLFPIAKPTGILLDKWLGKEEISYFKESEFKIMLEHHARSKLTDLERLETMGAVNFLALDDIRIEEEGEIINPESIISLPTDNGRPIFPEFERQFDDPFIRRVNKSREKWIIIVDEANEPRLVLNADQFLRDALYQEELKSLYMYCHHPVLVKEAGIKLGKVILNLKVHAEHAEDDVVDNDLILFWGDEKRIITGADILGRLLRGIVKRVRRRHVRRGA